MTPEPVLVAVDPMAHPDAIVAVASRMAAALGAPLAIVHVLPLSVAVDPDVLRNPAAHPVATVQLRAAEEAVLPRLKAVAHVPQASGTATTLHVAHGDPADAILSLTRSLGAQLVVIGTHGRTGLVRVALGSVAEAVVRACPVPVVTVRMGAAPKDAPIAHRQIPLD